MAGSGSGVCVVTQVRWRVGASRWRVGSWSGGRGRDGSLLVTQSGSGAARSLLPERVQVRDERGAWTDLVEDLGSALVESGDVETTVVPPVVDSSASLSCLSSRDGVVDPLVWSLRELVAFASVMTWSGWSPPIEGTANGSELVAALERAYASVQAQFPRPDGQPGSQVSELPDVVMITGSGLSSYGLTWGHFARDRWLDALASGRRPEMFIGGERLATGAVLTMQTLLHECAHVLAFVREIKDTSRQHRYHNREFVRIAESLGLEHVPESPDPTIGFSAVTLSTEGRRRWSGPIADLHRAITLTMPLGGLLSLVAGPGGSGGSPGGSGGHGMPVRRPKGTGGSSNVRLTCACQFIIRASRSTVEATTFTCGTCNEEFTES